MILFAVLSVPENVALDGAIAATFGDNSFKLIPGQWLVAANTTSAEVSNRLGITDGRNGSGIVVAIASYYGRASSNIWEWMKVKTLQQQ